MQLVLLLAGAAGVVNALHLPTHHNHRHTSEAGLPDGSWYHDADHPVHALFRRAVTPIVSSRSSSSSAPPPPAPTKITTDKKKYPVVGSDAWFSAYPSDAVGTPDIAKLPVAWTDALDAAVAAGKIPDIPVAVKNETTGEPAYNGTTPEDPKICSSSAQCRIDGDIWDAPSGVIGIGFDDGPLPASNDLYKFLQANNQTATHYFIGVNILDNPKEFSTAFKNGDDLAIHTWSHPLMTTKSNLEILAELGWTAQIIHDSTGGRVPKYWRPPYGDSDRRVHAIAKEVFGLTGIIWNHDTFDWSMTEGGTTAEKITKNFKDWLTGPKDPGLIILEHELNNETVTSFIEAYPQFALNGWKPVSQARLLGASPYRNTAAGNHGAVKVAKIYEPFKKVSKPLSSSMSTVASPGVSQASPTATPITTLLPGNSGGSATVVYSTSYYTQPVAAPANGNTSSGYTLKSPSFYTLLRLLLGVLSTKYLLL